MTPDEEAIRAVHERWVHAVNAADLAPLLPMMTSDATFMSPGGEPFDQAALAARFTAGHQEFHIRCISDLREVVAVGDLAYARSRDSVSATPRAGGKTAEHVGHRITIYRKGPDGHWRLARDAITLAPVEG